MKIKETEKDGVVILTLSGKMMLDAKSAGLHDYVKNLIDVVGKGGGLMVDCGIWFDEANHENIKAMVDLTKEYGVYG